MRKRVLIVLAMALVFILVTGCFSNGNPYPVAMPEPGMTVQVVPVGLDGELKETQLKELEQALQKRARRHGFPAPTVEQYDDKLVVWLPDVDEIWIVKLLLERGLVEFKTEDGKTVISNTHIKQVEVVRNPASGYMEVGISLTKEGTRLFAEATEANIGRTISICVDGFLLQNPVVKQPITDGKLAITGYENLDEVRRVATLISWDALPFEVQILQIVDEKGQLVFKG
jgi:preprotein translocase subunit SecD